MDLAFKEINFKFDDDGGSGSSPPTANTEVVIHRKRRVVPREEEDFRRNCREANTSTPKKDVKLAMNEARSSFFGLDQDQQTRRDSQMDTAELLEAANCTEDESGRTRIVGSETEEEESKSCDMNNNSSGSTKAKSESGLGSISAVSDEADGKLEERELLLDNTGRILAPVPAPRNINIIREPQYYSNNVKSPTQAVYLATTVPQNIKGNQIMGRHTPTRNSLRHSRMLVISKDLRGALNPLNIFYPKVATFFLILHILMGLLVTAIGLWFLLWAPSTRIQDNPYWSGLMLILCGSMGIVVMEFKRIPRNVARERCFNMLRINLIIVLFITLIATFAAFVFAGIHSLSLLAINTACIPASFFSKSASCICIFDKPVVDTSELEVDPLVKSNETKLMDSHRIFLNVDEKSQFHYRDLNCNEVTGAFSLILLGSSLANLIGLIATVGFLLLYYHGSRQVNLYATVRQPPMTTAIA